MVHQESGGRGEGGGEGGIWAANSRTFLAPGPSLGAAIPESVPVRLILTILINDLAAMASRERVVPLVCLTGTVEKWPLNGAPD